MKSGFGIRARIIVIITTLIVMIYILFSFMLKQIRERDFLIREVTENYQPSLTGLANLMDKFKESGKVFNYWLLSPSDMRAIFSDEFNFLNTEIIPEISRSLIDMSDEWNIEDQKLLAETIKLITDSLYFDMLDIISESYSLKEIMLYSPEELEFLLTDAGIIFLTSEIEQNTNYLYDKRNQEVGNISSEISRRTNELRNLILLISCILGAFLFLSIFLLHNYLRKFIQSISLNLEKLSKGDVPKKINQPGNNDFSRVITSMNLLFDYLRKLSEVATKIGKKDFSTDFRPLSDKDELGKAIVDLQDSLRTTDIEQKKYKKEEEERIWTSASIAKINDILRSAADNIEDLGYEIIKEIVKLTGSKVGGIFILNVENPPGIELLAVYAYDRRKYIQKTIMPGEGLIGRCVQENETLYLTDIPEGHLSIKSGLGEAKPVSLLIVPLKVNDKVIGVLEIASFKEFHKYQIEFTEIIAENIAKSLTNLKINIHTAKLLEQTRNQAEQLLIQEEKMKSNMDELTMAQNTFAEREKKLMEEIESLKARQVK